MEQWRDELYHHGIQGMKWGRRRYQNTDGSLTAAGRIRYGIGVASKTASGTGKKAKKMISNSIKAIKSAHDRSVRNRKEKIIRSGKWDVIKKHQDELTDTEYARALRRINASNAQDKLNPIKTEPNKTNALETVGKVGKATKNAVTSPIEAIKNMHDKSVRDKKEKIIRSGDMKEIKKHQSELSDAEFARALQRVNMANVAKGKAKFDSSLWDKLDTIKMGADKTLGYIQTAGKVAKLLNAAAEYGPIKFSDKTKDTLGTVSKIFNSMEPKKDKGEDGGKFDSKTKSNKSADKDDDSGGKSESKSEGSSDKSSPSSKRPTDNDKATESYEAFTKYNTLRDKVKQTPTSDPEYSKLVDELQNAKDDWEKKLG